MFDGDKCDMIDVAARYQHYKNFAISSYHLVDLAGGDTRQIHRKAKK